MKYILVLSLLFSFTHVFAMSAHRAQLLRWALTYPRVAQAARPILTPISRSLCCAPSDDASREQVETHKKELNRLRFKKKLLLYSRPIVTVGGVASVDYATACLDFSQPELIGLLMIGAAVNTAVFHTIDEWHSEKMKAIQKKMDELD